MAWTKIPKEHKPLFYAALPDDPRVEPVEMFGGVAGTVNGHMFGGLWADSVMVRLSPEGQAEVLAMGGEPFNPMGRGVMKDMVVLPAAVLGDREGLREWLRKAVEATAALPPKAKKGAKAATSKKAAKKKAAKEPAVKQAAPKKAAKKAAAPKKAAKKTAAPKKAAKKPAAR
jgi:TfoX/Sxy family transcriptional regulator of competence genes